MELIGEKIRSIRKSKGISQTAVADSCSIKQSSYANIENGKTQNITIEIGKGIAKALGFSFNELFDIEGTPQNQDQAKVLISEIELLKKQIEDKTLLIETLKNEKAHIRQHLLSNLVVDFAYNLGFTNHIILKTKDEEIKKLLIKKKEDISKTFNKNRDYYCNTGFLNQSDFDNFIKSLENLTEKDIVNGRIEFEVKGSEML